MDTNQLVDLELQSRRGGKRQRAEASSKLHEAKNPKQQTGLLDSAIAKDVVEKWSMGEVSASEVLINFTTNLSQI